MPIEHPKPKLTTIKELYARAIKCGFKDCTEPLFLDHGNGSNRSLNSRISHICARSEGGPRWDAKMSPEENRSADNLILMCLKHADEIDQKNREAHYTPDRLRAWKKEQINSYEIALKGCPISDDEAMEALSHLETKIFISANTINMGGAGGVNGGSGGGGAAIGPGALGGDGGSISKINLDGAPGLGPGSGGGGGGAIAPGSFLDRTDHNAIVGDGHSIGTDGNDGGDTSVGSIVAKGGQGGLSGRGARVNSDILRVSSLMPINSCEIREGLAFILGGAWDTVYLLNIDTWHTFAFLAVFEAGGITESVLTGTAEIIDPRGKICEKQSFPITIAKSGDIVRIKRCVQVSVLIHSFGRWSVALRSGERELARVDFLIRRAGER